MGAQRVASLCAIGLSLSVSACTSVGYVLQAAEGQLDLSCRAEPIDVVVENPETPEFLRVMLRDIPAVKAFAESKGLLPTPNYEDFVLLDRPAVVYVVSASDPLAFEEVQWSFPIVGSVPYLGWFDLLDAERFADDLAEEGWDVDVRGASAYSTLGWFQDPVLSSMIGYGDDAYGDLMNTVLHESVHATIYVSSQSVFNESLANFVGDRLTEEFLTERFGPGSYPERAWLAAEVRGKDRAARMHEAYAFLEKLYASKLTDAQKLARKEVYFEALEAELEFPRRMNNATLVGFRTYHAGDNAFESLFDACGRDWGRFWKVVHTIDDASFLEEQQQDLEPLVAPLRKRCEAG